MHSKRLIIYSIFLIGFIQLTFVMEWEFLTFLYALASYILLILIYRLVKLNFNEADFEYKKLVSFYLFLGFLSILRGLFLSNNYYDAKQVFTVTGPVMFLPLVSFIGSNKETTQALFAAFVKYLLPFSVVAYILSAAQESDGFGRFVSPVYYFILFFPFLSKKWKTIVVFISVVSFISNLDARSNMIRIIAAYGIMSLYYLRRFINIKLLKFARLFIFLIPFILLVLAITDTFNVFKMNEYFQGDYTTQQIGANGEIKEGDLTADTRTFIYQEVLLSSISRGTWFLGESAAGGYESPSFADMGTHGRSGSEVGFLNVFLYLGIIGVIPFTLIIFFASGLCINHSNNYLSKLLCLFIAFRWVYSWVEEFTNFDMTFFFLWLVIGLCFSKSFRQMSDEEILFWVRGIFDKRYRELVEEDDLEQERQTSFYVDEYLLPS